MYLKQMNPNTEKDFLKAYDDYGDAIFRYCMLQTSQRELAKDLTQETFTKVWEYLLGGKVVEQIRPFLYRVATNLIIDYRRKKRPTISLESVMEEGSDFEAKEGRENIEMGFDGEYAIKKLSQLDDKYKEALSLRYIEDMSIKEISEATGETETNISVRLHRGMEKLKNSFSHLR